MVDFSSYADTPNSPARSIKAVTPNDSTDLPDGVCKSLWVGGAGDVEVIAESDSVAVIIEAVPAGTLLPIRARRVLNGNTDATSILALY